MSDVTFDLREQPDAPSTRTWPSPGRVTLVETGDDDADRRAAARARRHRDEHVLLYLWRRRQRRQRRRTDCVPPEQGRQATVTAVQPRGRFGALDFDESADHGRFKRNRPATAAGSTAGSSCSSPACSTSSKGTPPVGSGSRWNSSRARRSCCVQALGFWQPMDTLRDKLHLEALWESGRAPWRVW